jgi:hypothetical protein
MRGWLVLVFSPARLFAKRLAYRPVRYELCSVSPRDEYGVADLLMMFVVGAALDDFDALREPALWATNAIGLCLLRSRETVPRCHD